MFTTLAILLSAGGVLATSLYPIIAQAASSAEIAPYVSAGGSVTAVGGLVYIARALLRGELVARPVAKAEEQSSLREKKHRELIERATEALEESNALIKEYIAALRQSRGDG